MDAFKKVGDDISSWRLLRLLRFVEDEYNNGCLAVDASTLLHNNGGRDNSRSCSSSPYHELLGVEGADIEGIVISVFNGEHRV